MPISEPIIGLYAIVDDSYPDPVSIAKAVLAGGGRLIQLRAKKSATADFIRMAGEINDACRTEGATFIVNDRIDIALAVGADGVHLGQDDLPLAAARKILGDKRIIGISTHSLDEARRAEEDGADYIGFGPIFKTTSKKDADKPKGLSDLLDISKNISIPVVAIGGVKMLNIESVFQNGAAAAAIISDIAEVENISKKTQQFVTMGKRICQGYKQH